MDNKYQGMTVNERLYVSGLMNDYDKYVREKNVEQVALILRQIDIKDEDSINAILQQEGLKLD